MNFRLLILKTLLFNFQGAAASQGGQLLYYITHRSLCQYLFEKFIKNFSKFRPFTPSFRAPDYYITAASICQYLFWNLLKLFSKLYFLHWYHLNLPLAECLYIISPSPPFVNTFFDEIVLKYPSALFPHFRYFAQSHYSPRLPLLFLHLCILGQNSANFNFLLYISLKKGLPQSMQQTFAFN